MQYYLTLMMAIASGAGGQLLLKAGAIRADKGSFFLFHPEILIGLVVYFLAALLYTFSLKKIPLTIAYPSVALSYVVVAIAAHLIWKDPLGWPQITGLFLITCGILVLFRT